MNRETRRDRGDVMRSIIFLSAFLLPFIQVLDETRAGEWQGSSFSGDIIATDMENPAEEMVGKLYVDKPGLRMEMVEDGQPGVQIIRFGEETMYFLMPTEKKYMEMPIQAQGNGSESLTSLYSGDVCAEFKEGKNLGRETLGGRRAEKWRCDNPIDEYDSGGVYRWFDKELGFVLREDNDNGRRMELRNIEEGRQTASLFEIPAGYEKMAMPMMPETMQGSTGAQGSQGMVVSEPGSLDAAQSGTAMPDLEQLMQQGLSEEEKQELQNMLQKLQEMQ